MNPALKKLAVVLCLLGVLATGRATTVWNYFISDAGDGNSLVTWTVSGDLVTFTGMSLNQSKTYLDVPISAPGIFNDSYVANGANQGIPTADGTLFNLGDVYFPIVLFSANNAAGAGNDTFSLLSTPLGGGRGPGGVGSTFNYRPATESIVIPIDYSEFNPGTYQSQDTTYSPSFTVNLTVGPVPEPSTMALTVLGALGLGQMIRRRDK